MPINVSEALDSDTCLTLTVERSGGPVVYVDGIATTPAPTTFKSLMSPQQPTAQQLEMLPGGERDKNIMLFISKRMVRGGDDDNGIDPDVIIFKGDRYKVIQVADWSTFGQTHAYAAKVRS